jgi:hypothetical protein
LFRNTGKTGGRYETDTHRSAPKVQKKWWISVTFVSHRPMLHLRAPSFAGITLFQNKPLNKLIKVFWVPPFLQKRPLFAAF